MDFVFVWCDRWGFGFDACSVRGALDMADAEAVGDTDVVGELVGVGEVDPVLLCDGLGEVDDWLGEMVLLALCDGLWVPACGRQLGEGDRCDELLDPGDEPGLVLLPDCCCEPFGPVLCPTPIEVVPTGCTTCGSEAITQDALPTTNRAVAIAAAGRSQPSQPERPGSGRNRSTTRLSASASQVPPGMR